MWDKMIMRNIAGINNTIILKIEDAVKDKIDISIQGNNNTIIIEEFVDVGKRLDINIVDDNSSVYIGRGTTFEETEISVADNGNSVHIGEDCMFSSNCKIIASDFHSIIDLSVGIRKNISRGVRIDNHVWVGIGALILKNSHIKSNSIIGANAIVNGEVPPNSIYHCGGISQGVSWERQREGSFFPMQNLHGRHISKFKLRNIEWSEKVIYNIENCITKGLNKIKGWAFLEDRESEKSKIYLCFFFNRKKLGK